MSPQHKCIHKNVIVCMQMGLWLRIESTSSSNHVAAVQSFCLKVEVSLGKTPNPKLLPLARPLTWMSFTGNLCCYTTSKAIYAYFDLFCGEKKLLLL